jgi:hypothetical protein
MNIDCDLNTHVGNASRQTLNLKFDHALGIFWKLNHYLPQYCLQIVLNGSS